MVILHQLRGTSHIPAGRATHGTLQNPIVPYSPVASLTVGFIQGSFSSLEVKIESS
jgi:hypothetical protein